MDKILEYSKSFFFLPSVLHSYSFILFHGFFPSFLPLHSFFLFYFSSYLLFTFFPSDFPYFLSFLLIQSLLFLSFCSTLFPLISFPLLFVFPSFRLLPFTSWFPLLICPLCFSFYVSSSPFFLSFLPPYSFFVSFSSSSSYFLLHSVTVFKDAWLTVPLIREINSPVRGALCVVNTYFPQHDSHAASALIQAPATLLSEELAASEKTRLKKTLFHFTLNSSHTWEDKGRFIDELRPKNLAVVEQRP